MPKCRHPNRSEGRSFTTSEHLCYPWWCPDCDKSGVTKFHYPELKGYK